MGARKFKKPTTRQRELCFEALVLRVPRMLSDDQIEDSIAEHTGFFVSVRRVFGETTDENGLVWNLRHIDAPMRVSVHELEVALWR